jgi:signal transduction histidine kinase
MPAPAASPSSRFTRLSVIAVTMSVFGAVVALMTQQLRSGLREQILRREAEMLAAIVSMQLDDAPGDSPADLFVAVLKTQKLAGVSGLRLYDMNRQLVGTFLLPRTDVAPPAERWADVAAGGTYSRLYARLSPDQDSEVILTSATGSAFEAWVPLRRSGSPDPIGAAQFWIEGDQLLVELGTHDRRLWTQAAIAWLAGSGVIVGVLSWAFRRLDAANRTLLARSEDLQRANRELVLAAKTSALGAVTAHLMHELKNPLAGLELIVAGQAEAGNRSDARGGELAAASELTQRLRTMVNDVVEVLRDEQTGTAFELTCADIAEVALAKVRDESVGRGISLDGHAPPDVAVTGRRANLAILVLRNLLQNALEATARGGAVRLRGAVLADGSAEFLVEDSGGGLPEAVRERLFQPCSSTKVGGSGLGLALSQRLAQQAGGRLELVRSGRDGTSFRLVLAAEA